MQLYVKITIFVGKIKDSCLIDNSYIMKWFSFILSIVSLLVSIVILVKLYPITNLNFDYLGAMIGILSFLVTILMGYQIYTVINVKENLKEVQKAKDEIDTKLKERADALTKEFRDELNEATPLIMALASSDRDIIESEVFRSYKESKPHHLSKELAWQSILAFLEGFSNQTDAKVWNKNIDELARNVTYDEAIEFYTDFAKMKNKIEYKNVECFMLELISKITENNNGHQN